MPSVIPTKHYWYQSKDLGVYIHVYKEHKVGWFLETMETLSTGRQVRIDKKSPFTTRKWALTEAEIKYGELLSMRDNGIKLDPEDEATPPYFVKDLNELAIEVTKVEGGVYNLSIAQVKEVINCVGQIMMRCSPDNRRELSARMAMIPPKDGPK